MLAPSWCAAALYGIGPTLETTTGKFIDTQPFSNVVVRFATFFDPNTLLLLNVMTFASQQIESLTVGGGGENEPGVFTVRSSRSYLTMLTSSHAPVDLKLRWNSF